MTAVQCLQTAAIRNPEMTGMTEVNRLLTHREKGLLSTFIVLGRFYFCYFP